VVSGTGADDGVVVDNAGAGCGNW